MTQPTSRLARANHPRLASSSLWTRSKVSVASASPEGSSVTLSLPARRDKFVQNPSEIVPGPRTIEQRQQKASQGVQVNALMPQIGDTVTAASLMAGIETCHRQHRHCAHKGWYPRIQLDHGHAVGECFEQVGRQPAPVLRRRLGQI